MNRRVKQGLVVTAFVVALSVRLVIYPYGVVIDATLPWEISSQTCRDIGLEFSPSTGVFINEC